MAVIIPTLRSPAARNPQPVVEGRRQDPLGHLVGDYGACLFLYQTPIVAQYEDGGAAYADTLPELVACRIWGGGATVMDWASHRWIVFATPAHGGIATLYACMARDWPAISGANAVLALHTTTRSGWRRYQPRGAAHGKLRLADSDATALALSLHTSGTPTHSLTLCNSDGTAKVLSLLRGGTHSLTLCNSDATARLLSLHTAGTPARSLTLANSDATALALSLRLPDGTVPPTRSATLANSDGTALALSLHVAAGGTPTHGLTLANSDATALVLSLHSSGGGGVVAHGSATLCDSDGTALVLSLHS